LKPVPVFWRQPKSGFFYAAGRKTGLKEQFHGRKQG